MIAVGSSADGPSRHKISLWKHDAQNKTQKRSGRTVMSVLWAMMQVVMAIATLMVVLQIAMKSVSNPPKRTHNEFTHENTLGIDSPRFHHEICKERGGGGLGGVRRHSEDELRHGASIDLSCMHPIPT